MPKQLDLSTLGLGAGEYSIQVKAVASGYKDSELSNSVQYTVVQQGWTFGVSGISNSSPTLTRTDDSVGYTWTKNSTTGIITTDFDEVFNFEEVTDEYTNVFIRIPKMYYKRTADTIQLSDHAQTGFVVHPLFIDDNDNEMDYFDVGKYKGYYSNGALHSWSLSTATGNLTIDDFREGARELNPAPEYTGSFYQYQIGDLRYLSWLWMFWMVVFATRQTADVMGTSWYSYSGATTGNTDDLVNNNLTYPSSICGQDPTTHSFKLFGIEDVVSAGYEFVDGIANNSGSIYYSLKPSKYINNPTSSSDGYLTLDYTIPTNSNFIVSMGLGTNTAIMLPNNITDGSYSTYYCDLFTGSINKKTCFFGCSGNVYSSNDGIFNINFDYSFTLTNNTLRSRLMRQYIEVLP